MIYKRNPIVMFLNVWTSSKSVVINLKRLYHMQRVMPPKDVNVDGNYANSENPDQTLIDLG